MTNWREVAILLRIKAKILLLCLCLFANAHADVAVEQSITPAIAGHSDYRLKDIESDQEGFLVNSSGDGFLAVHGFNLPRSQACFLLLEASFRESLFRPALFEAFWAVTANHFSERQKTSFLISHQHSTERRIYVLPLCKLYRFSGNLDIPQFQQNIVGFRLDYPSNRTIGLKIHQLNLISEQQLDALPDSSKIVMLESFERVPGKPFLSPDVALSKIYFGFEDGAKKLVQDWPFLVFWLGLIFYLLALIVRGPRNN